MHLPFDGPDFGKWSVGNTVFTSAISLDAVRMRSIELVVDVPMSTDCAQTTVKEITSIACSKRCANEVLNVTCIDV